MSAKASDAYSSSTGVYGPDSSGAPNYQPGLGPWGICDRCGSKRRRRGAHCLVREWTELWVCQPCLDPRPPEMTPPVVWPEGLPIPYPKPEPTPVYVDVPDPYS